MSLDFLSGLLLAAVAVAALVYVVKEWFGLDMPKLLAERSADADPTAGVNAHLIGATGRVVEAGGETGELRVKIGMERWRARLRAPADVLPAVGAEIEVTGVDGLMLEVVERVPEPAP